MHISLRSLIVTPLLGVMLSTFALPQVSWAEHWLPLPDPLEDTDFLYDGAPSDTLVELGRNLFFDPILSGNKNISCGTCHDPSLGSGDGLALGIGEGGTGTGAHRVTHDAVNGRIPRNAQALWNIGARAYTSMFHDGRVEAMGATIRNPAGSALPPDLSSVLAAQAFFPVTSPLEMAGQYGENPVADAAATEDRATVWALLAKTVSEIPAYVALFDAAFHEIRQPSDITYAHIAEALAAFQTVAFRSDNSPFDLVLRTGDMSHLSHDAQAGLQLFYGKAGCSGCHSGPLLTDHGFHAIAMPQIGPGKGHGADLEYWRETGFFARTEDEGRYRVSKRGKDLFAFRTPSLRNVAITGPWGHSGAYDTLEDVIRHHIDPVGSLNRYGLKPDILPELKHVQRLSARGSALSFTAVEPDRRGAFDTRDGWVLESPNLKARIAAANQLEPRPDLTDRDVAHLVAFLNALTDPATNTLRHWVPDDVPSGLDPQPN